MQQVTGTTHAHRSALPALAWPFAARRTAARV